MPRLQLATDPDFMQSYLRRAAAAHARGDARGARKIYAALLQNLPLHPTDRARVQDLLAVARAGVR
jgi:hypothetical protein